MARIWGFMVIGSVGEVHGSEYQGIEMGEDRFTTPALGELVPFSFTIEALKVWTYWVPERSQSHLFRFDSSYQETSRPRGWLPEEDN